MSLLKDGADPRRFANDGQHPEVPPSLSLSHTLNTLSLTHTLTLTQPKWSLLSSLSLSHTHNTLSISLTHTALSPTLSHSHPHAGAAKVEPALLQGAPRHRCPGQPGSFFFITLQPRVE